MERRPVFIITVPHAECLAEHLEAGFHTCDTLAVRAANELSAELVRIGAEVVGPIVGDTNRTVRGDLNRRVSRGSPFRVRVDREIRSAKLPFVLDVHSFDPGSGWDYSGPGEPLLVFLDGRERYGESGIPERIIGYLPRWLAERSSAGGSWKNDIVHAAVGLGARGAVLIEFSEAELGTVDKLREVIAPLSGAIVKI